MQARSYLSRTVTSTPYNPTRSTDVALSNAISGLLIIFFSTVVICAIVGYRAKAPSYSYAAANSTSEPTLATRLQQKTFLSVPHPRTTALCKPQFNLQTRHCFS